MKDWCAATERGLHRAGVGGRRAGAKLRPNDGARGNVRGTEHAIRGEHHISVGAEILERVQLLESPDFLSRRILIDRRRPDEPRLAEREPRLAAWAPAAHG